MSDFIFIMPIIDAVMSYPGPKYTYMYDYRNAVSTASMFNISLQDLGMFLQALKTYFDELRFWDSSSDSIVYFTTIITY